MARARTRLFLLFAGLVLAVVATAFIYMAGMGHLEGKPRTFWQALEWSSETLTTTGYGADARWQHPLMVLFVSLVQFVGVFLVFLVFPIYLIPFLEERFQVRLPREATDLRGHVVIFGFDAAVESLMEELEHAGVRPLVIEEDEPRARRLLEGGHELVFRSLDDGALEASRLLRARALIANRSDDENAAVTVTARQLGFTGEILALVEDPRHRRPLKLAGATAVYTPRHILGAALAARASRRISPRLSGFEHLSPVLQVQEVRLQPHSKLVGKSLVEADVGAATGATVIGQWVEGTLHAPATPEMVLVSRGILVVVGTEESIERLTDLAAGALPMRQSGHFLIGGYGEVGRKVAELLRDAGEQVQVIDRTTSPGVDLVGDVLDGEILERAGARTAQAAILALDSDSVTLFATVILKEIAPELPVIARVNLGANVSRIHRAGAEFALSISQVSGQVLARRLLGEEAVEVNPQLKVLKASGKPFAGRRPSEIDLRRQTGCSVVAVERGGEVVVHADPGFRFAPEDRVYVCGSTQSIARFKEIFGS
ncbi:MAG: NAD-binding protein [Acidobacteria bacterium]|nr:NAD-binding protein [Acidobacteriota bacterium]